MTELDQNYLLVEAGIRRLHARYADAVFRKDFGAFADCFTEDSVWLIAGFMLRGRTRIVEFLQERIADSRFVLMSFRDPILEIGEGAVGGRTYVTEINALKSAPPMHTIATYFERFMAHNGVWRRSWASFQLHYMGPEDLSGEFFAQPDFGPPPAMPPDEA